MNFKIFGGTPNHSAKSLCFSCSNCHTFQGQAASQIYVRCQAVYGEPISIRHPVTECSEYHRTTDQSLRDMKEIAYILLTKNGRTVGFVSPNTAKGKLSSGDVDKVSDAPAHEVEDD